MKQREIIPRHFRSHINHLISNWIPDIPWAHTYCCRLAINQLSPEYQRKGAQMSIWTQSMRLWIIYTLKSISMWFLMCNTSGGSCGWWQETERQIDSCVMKEGGERHELKWFFSVANLLLQEGGGALAGEDETELPCLSGGDRPCPPQSPGGQSSGSPWGDPGQGTIGPSNIYRAVIHHHKHNPWLNGVCFFSQVM